MLDGISIAGNTVWLADAAEIDFVGYLHRLRGGRLQRVPVGADVSTHGVIASDGEVWFTATDDTADNSNGRDFVAAQTGGNLHRYMIRTPGAGPRSITIDNAKTIYFGETNANAIGEVRGGVVYEATLPGGIIRDGLGPNSVTTVADFPGVWFVEPRNNALGVMSNKRSFRFYAPGKPNLTTLTAGRDHTLWLGAANSIGSIKVTSGIVRIHWIELPWKGTPNSLSAFRNKLCFSLSHRTFIGCYRNGRFYRKDLTVEEEPSAIKFDDAGNLWYVCTGVDLGIALRGSRVVQIPAHALDPP